MKMSYYSVDTHLTSPELNQYQGKMVNWTVNANNCSLDAHFCSLDAKNWTLDAYFCSLDAKNLPLDAYFWSLDANNCSLDANNWSDRPTNNLRNLFSSLRIQAINYLFIKKKQK